ncbi:unnamed protein product [Arctia plantaginis]|uniref:Uncharacterized protein n=1 Tax=Arctia plantaginis TaxID=874455 RepID=A0A8S0YZ52_ARCPL|nr:unnamed protein product [Arctia plantaginis]
MAMLTDIQVVLIEIFTMLILTELIDTSDDIPLNAESEENTLIQALYIVKLLKSDYVKSMQENELDNNFVDDEANSTCPDNEFNTTTPILYSVPASVSPITITPQPVMSVAPPEFINPLSHGPVATAESVLPYTYLIPPVANIITGEQIKNNSTLNTQTRPAVPVVPVENYINPYSKILILSFISLHK